MNPFTYISNISKNNKSNIEKIKEEKSFFKSPEIVAILVFIVISTEISSLFRWGPILVPIIFSITYFSNKGINYTNKSISTSDEVLKERMMAWVKK
jgi:hypothetical protein